MAWKGKQAQATKRGPRIASSNLVGGQRQQKILEGHRLVLSDRDALGKGLDDLAEAWTRPSALASASIRGAALVSPSKQRPRT
jgi:hypothetical protein